MYLIQNWHKLLFVILLAAGYSVAASAFLQQGEIAKTEQSLTQMSDDSGRATEHLGASSASPNMLLQLPPLENGTTASKPAQTEFESAQR